MAGAAEAGPLKNVITAGGGPARPSEGGMVNYRIVV